jgi:zinc dependent phospholipase C
MSKVTVALLASLLLASSHANAWGLEAHKFIVSQAIDLLPDEIRPFFDANRALIVEHAIDPDLWRNAGFTEEPPNHFLDMDAYGPYPFKSLPRDYDAALKKFGKETLDRNGRVPWRTSEIAGRLIRGFEGLPKQSQYARSDITFFSAVIGHYVADANVPLHSVLNYDGQLTGQHGVHYRWESDLFIRYQNQLSLNPGRLKSIQNERDFIFDTLLESFQLAPAVLAADKEAVGNQDVYDDRYFEALFAKTKPILEKRLSDAITAVASVITSAWAQAGRPALPVTPPPRPPQRRRVNPANASPAIP